MTYMLSLTSRAKQFLSSMKGEKRSLLASEKVWAQIQREVQDNVSGDPFLARFARHIVLDSQNMAQGLARLLSHQQIDTLVGTAELAALYEAAFLSDPAILESVAADMDAVVERDPAVDVYYIAFLYFKGFHALQNHRAAHWLWENGRQEAALFLQNRASILYGVDIHPAAQIGKGIMIDHATGLVIGETAVVEDNVSLLHGVTLGGTGKERGDRHPKIREGVMIGASATLLGNVEVGKGARIAAGSVVVKDVPENATAVGVPARILRGQS
jgi:serine O-acetyltransferase